MLFIHHFIELFVEAAPWLLMGFAVAGIMKVEVEMEQVKAGRPQVVEFLSENGGKSGKDLK